MLFVFDVDNTLLVYKEGKSYFPKSVKKAVQLIKDRGFRILFATGRSYNEMKDVLKYFDLYDAVLNDGAVLVCNNQVVYEKHIDQDVVKSFVKTAYDNDLPVIGENFKYLYANIECKYPNSTSIINTFSTVNLDDPKLKNIGENERYSTLSCFVEFDHPPYKNAKVLKWPNGISISPKGIDKCYGIYSYLEMYDISRENVFVFGDSLNDLCMFREFHQNSYVSNNAVEEVKQQAKYVLDDLECDGIYKAVKTILER